MCLRGKVDDMARRVDKTQRDLRRGMSHPGTIADLRVRWAGVRRQGPAGTKPGPGASVGQIPLYCHRVRV